MEKELLVQNEFSGNSKQKRQPKMIAFRGPWRIRTAVRGFADRCLATRPRNLNSGVQKYKILQFLQQENSK